MDKRTIENLIKRIRESRNQLLTAEMNLEREQKLDHPSKIQVWAIKRSFYESKMKGYLHQLSQVHKYKSTKVTYILEGRTYECLYNGLDKETAEYFLNSMTGVMGCQNFKILEIEEISNSIKEIPNYR